MKNNTKTWLYLSLTASLLIRLFIIFLNKSHLVKIVADDGYYYFTLARNFAAGLGLTFDGTNLTNGFHPLYLLLIAPIFKIPYHQIETPVVISIILLSIISVLTGLLIFRIVSYLRDEKSALFAAVLWLFNPYVIFISMLGVEIALYVFVLAVAIDYYLSLKSRSQYLSGQLIVMGILLGFTVLGRTEGLIFVFFILLDLLFSIKKSGGLKLALSKTGGMAFMALLVFSPWLIWNFMHFGTLLQTSSQSIAYLNHKLYFPKTGPFIFNIAIKIFNNTFRSALPLFNIAFGDISIFLLLGGFASYLLWKKSREIKKHINSIKEIKYLLFGVLAVFAYYSYYMWYFQKWYYLSSALVIILLVGIFSEYLRKAWLISLILLIFIIKISLFTSMGFIPHQIAAYKASLWLKESVPTNQTIGAFNSGIYGYYSKHKTINLDGVMNNAAASAIKSEKLLDYLLTQKVSYISDAAEYLMKYQSLMGGDFNKYYKKARTFPLDRFGGMMPGMLFALPVINPANDNVVIYERIRPE